MKLAFVLQAYGLWLGLCVLSSVAHALALRLAQVQIRAFRLFTGASVARVRLIGMTFELGWVPVGTSILYDVPTFWLRPLWMRVGVTLAGPLVLLPYAAALLGPQAAWSYFLAGFVQLPLGALHPLSVAPELIARLHGVLLASVPITSGILAAKLAALELLPLGGVTMAQVLLELIGHGDRDDDQIRGAWFLTLNVLALILLMGCWGVAMAVYVLSAASG